jgi:xanthine dehydrogenase YagS FAD-binding subunit
VKPWRATEAEKYLSGKAATDDNFKAAADAEMKAAKPFEHNRFNVELGKRAIVHALRRAARTTAA